MSDFGTFNFGNILTQAGQIQDFQSRNQLRQSQIQTANALAQRNARGDVLLGNALAGMEGGGPAGNALNELAAFDTGLAQQVLDLQQDQRAEQFEDEQREADQASRAALSVKRSANPATFARLSFPEFFQNLEEQGIDTSEMTDAGAIALADDMLAQFGARSSLSLKELGFERDVSNIIQFQGPGGEIIEVRSDSARADELATDPSFNRVGVIQRTEAGEPGAFDALAGPVTRQAQTDIIGIDDSLARLDEIDAGFDTQFLQVPGRLDAKITELQEKFRIGDPSPEDRQFLADFSAFQRDAIENINLEIKRITGAQMSEKEADRIRQGFPDPGEGIFDGDSPTVFRAKLNSVRNQLLLTRARRIVLLSRGIDLSVLTDPARTRQFDNLSLGAVERLAEQRAEEVRAAGGDDAAVRRMLLEEFGLGS